MTWSFSLGRLFGSELKIHVTFFLLLAWVGFAAYSAAGMDAAIGNVVFVIALFICVVAHEYGHALMARRYGIKTPDITLWPIGGLARLERMPENPVHEVLVALAGPAVNIVIWAVLTLLGARIDIEALASIDMTRQGFMGQLAAVNLILALFNLIPAFPMDGGRVFRALLSIKMGRVRATRVAAFAGQMFAVILGFAGLSSGNAILVLIAVFVFVAAAGENSDVAMRSISRRLMAREAMITQFEALEPGDSVQAAADALIRTTQHEFPVLGHGGRLEGFVSRNDIFKAMVAESGAARPVSTIMEADIPRVGLTAPLDTVLDALYRGRPAVAVCAASGDMIGYITRENIGELMVIQGR